MKKLIVLSLMAAVSACGGVGTVSLTTWGEEYIEQEIPAAEFEDGHTVKFTKFLVVVNEFQLATKTGTSGPKQAKTTRSSGGPAASRTEATATSVAGPSG